MASRAWFSMSAGPGAERRFPDVTYSSARGEYLVVWEHQNGSRPKVRARRVVWSEVISPPNPRLTEADTSFDVADIQPLVGSVGRTVTPLRPVGTCEFDGRRVECVAEMGLIEANQPVRAVRIDGRELVVTLCKEEGTQST